MDEIEPPEVARAKTFWMEVDVDHVFDELSEYLIQLRRAIKTCAATDREYVQGMNMITLLESGLKSAPAETNDSFVEVVIGGDPQTPLPPLQKQPTSPLSIPFDGSVDPLSPSYVSKEDVASPIPLLQLHFQPHDCSQACVPNLPKSAHYFRWHNPLKVPLHLSFQRECAGPQAVKSRLESERAESVDSESCDPAELGVTYQAPCGRSLHTPEEVLSFLLATGSHNVLQMDYFSFNPKVRLDCPRPLSWRPVPTVPAERDLSRGVEPTPVELCIGEEGARPEEFRYRKERWPHGCFLSRGPLFRACCDCTDGCLEAKSCTCIRMTYRGQHYLNQRLAEPIPSGIFECGPWCGCERSVCQNRVVQHGLRVRLQVFQTADRGWGVRCRDDLDRGTFVCTYAGVVLRACLDPGQPLPPKRPRAELPSDDEVEVVTEWLAPVEGRVCPEQLGASAPTSAPLHVPVIQRPADPLQPDPNPLLLHDMVKAVVVGSQELGHSPTGLKDGDKGVKEMTQMHSEPASKAPDMKEVKRGASPKTVRPDLQQNPGDQMYYLDATKDGNVGRFINHSCVPNLFVQNVFTDSHDPNFPMIAFFTNKVVKSGTELTWNYSLDPESGPDKIPCVCGSDSCQGLML